MFCLKCGKEIGANPKFCPYCGAAVSSASGAPENPSAAPESGAYAAPEAQLTSAAWSEPAPGGRRRGGALLIGIAAAAVLVVVIIAAVAGGLFSSPKGRVEKALAKTAAAYADVGDKLGLPQFSDLAGPVGGRAGSQRVSLTLNSIAPELTGWEDMSYLKGAGVRLASDWDCKGRDLDAEAALLWDGEDLASIQLLVDNGTVMLASPQFTKGEAYGLNTETLGKDLQRMGVEEDEFDLEKFGFNLFDLVEKAVPSEEQSKAARDAMSQAGKQLLDAVEVEKGGKQSVEVNGKSANADLYHVLVPKSALRDYINAWEDAMKLTNPQDILEEVYRSMGLDEDAVEEMMSGLDSTDVYGQMADSLKEAVKILGDVELDVYVSGGYLSAVEYSNRIEGSKVELGLYLGGGENYVDNLSLEISVDGEKITLESAGNHAAAKGVFTDETTLRMGSGRVTSELRYEPKAAQNNFEWDLKVDSTASLSMEGQLTTAKDSLDLRLEDLSISAAGSRLLSLEASYYLGPCDGMQVSLSSPKMLLEMDEDDLEDLYYDLQDNVTDWAYDVMDKLPSELLNALY